MPVALRPAIDCDFDYCRRLYFGEMEWIIEKLNLDRAAQEVGFKGQWNPGQVRIIVLDGVDIGWLQTVTQDDDFFIAQLFVDRPFQRRGIGTELMKRLIEQAERARQAVLLSVVKINPARRLYERLGFRVTHEDGLKAYMKRDRNLEAHSASPSHEPI
jgi:ribosomal protein S18 acetylase RimI-like enzyme